MKIEAIGNGLRGRLTVWKAVLLAILALGAYATFVRFSQGLGAATNLSDAFPWGLWIGFDVLVGVGLAAGGFVVAATVHVFRMEKYEPIARPAVLTAFLGYLLVIVALLFDLGRPDRIWHPMVMWNTRSVMFEVAWCVTLYTIVLALEFSPLVLERLRLKRALRLVRRVYVPLVIAGVLLSTLHQSSLGTLYLIAPEKLHGLWYTPLLPVFFFVSAVGGGLAMTIFESFMSQRAFGKRLEAELLQGLGKVIVVVLAVYATWRLLDLGSRGNLALIFALTPESVLFWGELGLGVLLPMALLALPAVRRSESGLFFGALLVIMGFIVNRLNVATTGMAASSGVTYVPSLMEFAVTLSIVAAGFGLFALAVKFLPVFPQEELPNGRREPQAALEGGRPAVDRPVLIGLWSLLLLGAVAVWASPERRTLRASDAPLLRASTSGASEVLALPEPYVFPQAETSPGEVTFSHATHVDAAEPRCAGCHAGTYRINLPGALVTGGWSLDRVHQGDLCASCHDGTRAFAIIEDCERCHQ
jgi:c(7)-type cytochrome triheme protein